MNITISNLQRGMLQTIVGTIEWITDEDEFILKDGTGQIRVDANLDNDRRLPVTLNQALTVTGQLDDDFEFDALKITQADGTAILDRLMPESANPNSSGNSSSNTSSNLTLNPQNGIVNINRLTPSSVQTIAGQIARIIDEDEFILQDSTRRIRVDANLDDRRLSVARGDRVTVIGQLDNDDFEFQARRIMKANGAVVFDRLGTSAASAADDILVGGRRSDQLNGGAGNDMLIGGFGNDTLTGGAGRDRFVYETVRDRSDRITDFSATEDVIDLSKIFARRNYSSTQPFSDYVDVVQSGSRTVIRIDPDGDRSNRGLQQLVAW
ncbi:type I secretion C-terminal target domain-containing protein [Leptolyngbya sp. 7M]|uniref:type I secretion C-terminal target domain-containing protein n=1 Tax=Leptolyngbya sp. 7M TaxID=2812896 RepID=UPI001B8BAF62|nr:type I secretion C-terminal target domain-containing protein [Leptolyngbya sp. 7M]QYO63415.1 type I secretion C-terminal target domain-containing protein [Leptolyngbya sp. 7M]